MPSHPTFEILFCAIGANNTGEPSALSFYLCLLGAEAHSGTEALVSYIIEDMSRHAATLCRLHNDFSSVQHDRLERNLNSVYFSEFLSPDGGCPDGVLKKHLMEVADYEKTA